MTTNMEIETDSSYHTSRRTTLHTQTPQGTYQTTTSVSTMVMATTTGAVSSSLSHESARAIRLAELDRLEEEERHHPLQRGHNRGQMNDAAMDEEMKDEFDWTQPSHQRDDGATSSIHRPLPSSNFGYQMLLRQGWRGIGSGLGKHAQGIAEPIMVDLESGAARMGLGMIAEYDRVGGEATGQRRRMEVEAQAEETNEQRLQRESQASLAAAITANVSAAKASLRCDDCGKQYAIALDYEAHLSSYDHNHTVRLKEARRADQARRAAMNAVTTTIGEDGSIITVDPAQIKAEKRRLKEEQQLEAQMKAAAAADAAATQSTTLPFTMQPIHMTPIAATSVSNPPTAPVAAAPFAMKVGGFSMMKKPILMSKPKFSFSGD